MSHGKTARLTMPPSSAALLLLGLLAASLSPSRADGGERIEIAPKEIRLTKVSPRAQVVVTLVAADGSVRDVTSETRLEIAEPKLAKISASGVVAALADGASKLRATYRSLSASATVKAEQATRAMPVSFAHDVSPLLSKAGCNQGACHGNLNGKGGFRLSLRGDDPRFDHLMLTRDTLGRRIDRARPTESLLLRKAIAVTPHEGGKRFEANSPEYRTLQRWIAEGARDDTRQAPAIVKLEVFPSERLLAYPGRRQQLSVIAQFADGSRRDVTREAAYDSSEPTLLTVGAGGLVEASQAIEATVSIRFGAARTDSRLAFLADRPGFVWGDYPRNNFIDDHVLAKLQSLKMNPSGLASDSVFLRRAFLAAIGILPTPDETRQFLADRSPSKRDTLIDRLVERPEFAEFWALKWSDVLRNEEKTMGTKGIKLFHDWLVKKLREDRPLDEMIDELVSTTGSTWEHPPASFYRTNRDPMTAAETVGQVFLGVRLQCAKCHNHPFDVWTQNDYYGLTAFFANIERKEVDNKRRDKLDKHEINGDVLISLSGNARMRQPSSGVMLDPTPLGGKPQAAKKPEQSLDRLADWLRNDPQVSRNLANRIWYHVMGRGIVDPPDDFRGSNPPSNEELLEELTEEFVARGKRLRPLVAAILKSRAFQLESEPNETNADDQANFARSEVRLLPAEVTLDTLSQVTEVATSFRDVPKGTRAAQLPGVKSGGAFLKTFGKPDRLLTCECERSDSSTLAQSLQMINGPIVREKIEAKDNRIGRLLKAGKSNDQMIEELFLASLCRYPTDDERRDTTGYVKKSKDRRRALEDILWALVNSKEFLLRY